MRRLRIGRPQVVVGASIAALTLAILPGTALAAPRDTVEYQLVFHGSVDCGTFMDNYEDRYDVRETDEFDADGNLTRVLYHAAHTSDDVNSVTGLTLHEHGHFYEVDDFVNGTFTITGSQEVANRNGHGVVIQDTGRIVYDAGLHADLLRRRTEAQPGAPGRRDLVRRAGLTTNWRGPHRGRVG